MWILIAIPFLVGAQVPVEVAWYDELGQEECETTAAKWNGTLEAAKRDYYRTFACVHETDPILTIGR